MSCIAAGFVQLKTGSGRDLPTLFHIEKGECQSLSPFTGSKTEDLFWETPFHPRERADGAGRHKSTKIQCPPAHLPAALSHTWDPQHHQLPFSLQFCPLTRKEDQGGIKFCH